MRASLPPSDSSFLKARCSKVSTSMLAVSRTRAAAASSSGLENRMHSCLRVCCVWRSSQTGHGQHAILLTHAWPRLLGHALSRCVLSGMRCCFTLIKSSTSGHRLTCRWSGLRGTPSTDGWEFMMTGGMCHHIVQFRIDSSRVSVIARRSTEMVTVAAVALSLHPSHGTGPATVVKGVVMGHPQWGLDCSGTT
jgi:hypothetical protein